MQFTKFAQGDVLKMKKKHPCGSFEFKVMRTGSDIRLVCIGCSRDLTLPRESVEKSIKCVIPSSSDTKGN